MTHSRLALITGALAVTCLIGACASAGDQAPASTGAGVSATAAGTETAQRTRLSRSEIIAAYTGRTLKASDHAQTYNADGTFTNAAGRTGRWSVSDDGILTMTGPLNLSLEVYREGSRYYHRNVSSGRGAYYTI